MRGAWGVGRGGLLVVGYVAHNLGHRVSGVLGARLCALRGAVDARIAQQHVPGPETGQPECLA
ncbi:hypothetical protein, partial [Nocardia farcinica]|uniref:hypothetical protein n=1 Tax=Nocardia farcinica TaxID=37329 RepID=UPI002458524B